MLYHSLLVGDNNAPDDVAKMLHNVIGLVNEEVRELLVIRLGSRHAEELDREGTVRTDHSGIEATTAAS